MEEVDLATAYLLIKHQTVTFFAVTAKIVQENAGSEIEKIRKYAILNNSIIHFLKI